MSNAAQVEALFFAALEHGTAAEHATYLDSACGSNAELRRQVAKLLNAHPQVGDFLKKPVVELWDFALEIGKLFDAGLTISDLRWLVAKGHAEHRQETSFYGDPHRSFRNSVGLTFVATTCFVLTPKGTEFASSIVKESAAARLATATEPRSRSVARLDASHSPVDPPTTSHNRWQKPCTVLQAPNLQKNHRGAVNVRPAFPCRGTGRSHR